MPNPGVAGFGSGEQEVLARSRFRTILFCLLPSALCLLQSCVYWTPRSIKTSPTASTIANVPMQKWGIENCGAGSLSTVLQHYGDATTMAEWDSTLPKTRGGVMSIDLVLAARQHGFDAQLVTGTRDIVEKELRENRPVIVMLQVVQAPGKGYDFFHYVVLDGIDAASGLIRTQFGDGKARWVRFDRLENAWNGGGHAAILIRQKDPVATAIRAAVEQEQAGKYALAADSYRAILDQHPDSILAWTNLGNAEMQLGRRPAAEEAFRKAVALDATNADALNNLAWLLYEEKRLDEAEPLARQAVAATAPDVWTRLDTLARILAARGRCDEAQTTFRRAIESVPSTRAEARHDIEAGLAEVQRGCPAS